MDEAKGTTRRKFVATLGTLPVAVGAGALAARTLGDSETGVPTRFELTSAKTARGRLQQDHLPNVPLVTHRGKTVRFYDDLVKDKKVVITFIDTRTRAESEKVTANLVALQRFFGSRVGKDIHLYTITRTPEHDTPAVLKRWATKHGAGPGWTFLTGKPADVEKLRHSLGFASNNAAEDADPRFAIGILRHGVEPEMRWAHCQSQAPTRVLAHSMLLDFGTDPADSNPPPLWNCKQLVAGLP